MFEVCVCPMNLCCFVYMYENLLYCSHVWMAPGKISCELTGSPSLNKVFELNWIELIHKQFQKIYFIKIIMVNVYHWYLPVTNFINSSGVKYILLFYIFGFDCFIHYTLYPDDIFYEYTYQHNLNCRSHTVFLVVK